MSISGGGLIEEPDAKAQVEQVAAKGEALRAARMARAAGSPSSPGRQGSLIRRWRERRRLRRAELLERKVTGQETLRDLKRSRDLPGQWTGGGGL
jgi:hypothetical protein